MAKRKRAPRGRGSIDSRGPGGQFRARIRVGGQCQTETFETEQGARSWLDLVATGLRRPDRASRVIEATRLTLAGALRKRLEHISAGKNLRNERYAVARLEADFPALCAKPVYDVDDIDIEDFVAVRRGQVAAATVNRDLSILSHTFNLARAKFGCTGLRNPIGKGTRLKLPRGRVRRLSEEEEQALLRQAAVYEVGSQVRIGPIIRFACDTAMRCGEIASMRWERVDLVRGTVFLPDTKNGESRSVPLWLETRALLRDLGPLEEGPVWAPYEAIRSAWRRVRAAAVREAIATGNTRLAASLKDLRFHDLRHEGTSRLIERTGWDNAKVMAVTGHKTPTMLARYSHLRSADLASEMAALEGGGANIRLARPNRPAKGDELPADVRSRAAWLAVSNNEPLLRALVAARPIRDVAADLHVSDGAVHKALARLGIEKQGKGYWLRGRCKERPAQLRRVG